MSSEQDEVLDRFYQESIDHLAEFENDLLALEQQGDDIDYELANCIFRGIHSIKGGSGFFGLDRLGRLAHHMANVLDRVRREELTLNADVVNCLLTGGALLNKILLEPSSKEKNDIEDAVAGIESMLASSMSEEEIEESVESVDIVLPTGKTVFTINKYDFERAAEEDRGGSHVYLIKYDLIKDIEERDKTPWEVISELLQVCVFIDSKIDIDSFGTLDSEMPNAMPFYVLISTIIEVELIFDFLELERENVFLVGRDGRVGSVDCNGGLDIIESMIDYMDTGEVEVPVIEDIEEDITLKDERGHERDSVRIRRTVMEKLGLHADELANARDELVDSCRGGMSEEMEKAAINIDTIARQLQDTLKSTKECVTGMSDAIDENLHKKKDAADRQSLVIMKSGSQRFGVPLALIKNLEKVSAEQIDVVKGRKEIDYSGNKLPLFSVADESGIGQLAESAEYIVAVVSIVGRNVGFVYNAIVTILNCEAKINAEQKNTAGIIGSVNIKDRVVLLADLYDIVFRAMPEWDKHDDLNVNADRQGVLIVDDSDFFLTYIRRVVEGQGFIVYTARNGYEALQVLDDYSGEIGLVLADIVMPEMGGVELVKETQADKRFTELVVIGMSSVAGEMSKSKVVTTSFEEGLSKYDCDGIIAACTRFTSSIS